MKEIIKDNVFELFMKLLPVQIFVVIVSSLSGIINGLVIGNNLSDTAMAALGLVNPMTAFLAGVSSIVSGGAGILCGNYMGRGDGRKVNQVFSVSIILLVIFSAVLTAVGLLFAEPLASLFGANEMTMADTAAYIRGISIGILPQLLIPCFMTFLQMCNRSNTSLIMTIILGAFNAVFCLVGVHVLKTDIFGVGVATSLSKIATMICIIIFFITHSDLVRFKSSDFDMPMALELLKVGFPASLAGILYAIRNVFINSYASSVGGTSAVNSLAILLSFGGIFDSFNIGVGSTLTMLASVFIGERDIRSIKKLIRTTLFIGLILAGLKVLFAFTLGKWTAMRFGANAQLAEETSLLIRYYSISSPINILSLTVIGIYQCLGRIMLCNTLYLFNCIIVPLLCCTVLANIFGIEAIWSCYYLAEIVTLILVFIHCCIRKKGLCRSVEDILYLDDGFSTENKYSMSIRNADEIVTISKNIEQFCRKKGIDDKRAMLAGLCMEEMVGNVVEHGFIKDNKENVVDVFAIVENDEVTMRLRDNCVPFDPNTRANMVNDNDPCKNIGIRMVSKIAAKMNYQSTFGMNVLSIKI